MSLCFNKEKRLIYIIIKQQLIEINICKLMHVQRM